jgi:hypothetical protein
MRNKDFKKRDPILKWDNPMKQKENIPSFKNFG